MRTKLKQAFVDRAKADDGAERTVFWDESLPGFGLVVTASGHRSFCLQYRSNGQSRRLTLAGKWLAHENRQTQKANPGGPSVATGAFGLSDARREAQAARGAIARGRDPLMELRAESNAAKTTLAAVCEAYLNSREAKSLRSVGDRRALISRHALPRLGKRQVTDIKRSDIGALIKRIEANAGPIAARNTLAALRKILNWHAIDTDGFNSPIVRGMAPPPSKERERVLSDGEIRAVWRAAEAMKAQSRFGAMVQFILLTATRRDEAADANRAEIGDNIWTVPAARYKTKIDHVIPLSGAAIALLGSLPAIGHKGWIFTTSGSVPISGFSGLKKKLDVLTGDLPNWTLHDLRRTARSLLSRAGVAPDHAERVLGHTIAGVRGVYDRYGYLEEKRHAFEALAAQIDRILHPVDNVISLRG